MNHSLSMSTRKSLSSKKQRYKKNLVLFIYRHFNSIFLCLLSLSFFSLMSFDINHWYYSAIGDEYAFYQFARDIVTGKSPLSLYSTPNTINIFAQNNGVYDITPVAYIFQSLIMFFLGVNHSGWVISTIFSVIISGWLLFYFAKEMFGRTIAMFSSLLFFSSQYLWGFSHLGYPNLQPIPITLAALYCFIRGRRLKNITMYFLSGLFAGLGFYTYYSSRIVIVLLFAFILLQFRYYWKNKRFPFYILFGFMLLFLPFIFNNQDTFFQKMFSRSIVASSEIPGNRFEQFNNNLLLAIKGFIINEKASHFVSGPLLDPLSAMMSTFGLILMTISFRRYIYIYVWLILALIITGGFSQYTYLPITRLHYLLPIFSITGGYFLKFFQEKIKWKMVGFGVVFLIFLTVYSLNVYQFFWITPKRMDLTLETITIGAITTLPKCQKSVYIIYKSPEPLLEKAIDSYRLRNKIVYLTKLETFDFELFNKLSNNECIIYPLSTDQSYQNLTTQLTNLPNMRNTTFPSLLKNRSVEIFYRK